MADKREPGSKEKIRLFFLQNMDKVVTSDEIRAASGNVAEWARRLRELRDEEGYQILSHRDRADLKPGEYIMETDVRVPAFARNISARTRAYVLERNGFTCQMCGSSAGDPDPLNPNRKVQLHIGHIIDKDKGGSDDPNNLQALCTTCNQGQKNLTPMKPDLKHLLIEVRRARTEDQLEVLKWLEHRFNRYKKAEEDTA